MKKWITPDWPAPASIHACTTLKTAWGTPGHSVKNRESTEKLKALLELPSNPAWLYQTHGNIAIEADPDKADQEADASYTSKLKTVSLVLTADCLPVLICSKAGTQVAAIHAGWRGLASGIIESTLAGMARQAKNQAFSPGDLLVWLGPAIGPEKFEVGKDVFDAFASRHPASENAFRQTAENKWLANLYELAKVRLHASGVTDIYGGEYCTYSQAEYFYSYRRDHGRTGRMASVIWMEE